jgi:hypothetical protein
MELRLFKGGLVACLLVLSVGVALAEKPNPTDFYKLEFNGELSAGAPGKVVFTIVGINGYKWNKEFPAKLTLETSESALVLPSTRYRQIPSKDNWEKGVKVAATAKRVGKFPMTATMDFSVCKADICRLFRKQEFKVHVKAQ